MVLLRNRAVKWVVLIACCWASSVYADPVPDETVMTVIIVFGDPGHSAIHLAQGSQQLYWDPGGVYGTELTDCLEDASEAYCHRFAGFPWSTLQSARHNDVLLGEAADLMRVISIYHLDGDAEIKIYTFHLMGIQAATAWALLAEPETEFDTDRNSMFCVKGVTDYLETIGGQFEGMAHPWFPEALGVEMARLGAKPSDVFTLHHPRVQAYIQATRHQAGLAPWPFALAQDH